jgi:hypothetical protein
MKLDHREHLNVARAAMKTAAEQLSLPDTNTAKRGEIMTNRTAIGSSAVSMNMNAMHAKGNSMLAKEFKLQELTMLSIAPILRIIHHWWLQRAEHHYLICADVEQQRVREAQMNVAYYQKRAALARSARC